MPKNEPVRVGAAAVAVWLARVKNEDGAEEAVQAAVLPALTEIRYDCSAGGRLMNQEGVE